MLTELVKALEDKKSVLERELVAIQEKQALLQSEREKLAREAGEKERALAAISEQAIKKYKVLWRSYTPPNPFPCPFCFVLQKKISPWSCCTPDTSILHRFLHRFHLEEK